MPPVQPAASSATSPGGAAGSASGSEKRATSSHSSSAPPASSAAASRLRSCVVCRTRKVRCDKLSPCSNCRRAGIACVLPSADRPPRWARRLERVANNAAADAQASQASESGVAQVMERLRSLEGLVKELSGQLEQAHAANANANAPPPSNARPDADQQATTGTGGIHKQFGRLVLQDANRSRYVTSGFWSRVNDELEGLQLVTRGLAGEDSGTSEDESSPGKSSSATHELDRPPSERHAFMFRHNLSPSAPAMHELQPLPSQIPFLLDVFSENVNTFSQIVHMPTVRRLVRDQRSKDMASVTPANEALLFSIYYAAITSMEEDDVQINFGSSKTDLNLKFRLGLEYAFAKADFLNIPDLVVIQAFCIFLALARRHDSPRYIWMMTGLVIRMAQAIGLQRDGAHFSHLSAYEVEMRRRTWWNLCFLDVRASEDQGTDLTIPNGSFDTKIPLNVNDADIDSMSKAPLVSREGITDATIAVTTYEVCELTRQMMAIGSKDGLPDLERQNELLNELCGKFERNYFHYTPSPGDITQWVTMVISRLMMAKMTLIIYFPALFSSPNQHISDEIRTKLLVSAIEVAEYNHMLNAETACRHWRWIFQTYTHWYATVYLLIEISRRPWSPIIERAWVALHSPWLIPTHLMHMGKNMRTWIPLRKLMATARNHRNSELEQLRADPSAAQALEVDEQKIPEPGSLAHFPAGSNAAALFQERWRQLLRLDSVEGIQHHTPWPQELGPGNIRSSTASSDQIPHNMNSTPAPGLTVTGSNANPSPQPSYFAPSNNQANNDTSNSTSPDHPHVNDGPVSALAESSAGQVTASHNPLTADPMDWSGGQAVPSNFIPWSWPDSDPSLDVFANIDADLDLGMNLTEEVNWYDWVESAKHIQ